MEVAALVPGLDAVIGGHSHTCLSSSDPRRACPCPIRVDAGSGGIVLVGQAGAHSRRLGHLELTFDAAGNPEHAGGDTNLLDASVTQDEAIPARIAELAGPIEEPNARVVAGAAEVPDGERERCRQQECVLGSIIAGAMLHRVRDGGIRIAIQNGGGIRASIDAGPVTMGGVLTVLPFRNMLSTFQRTGEAIVKALENGVSAVEDGGGRFPQMAGLR